MQALICFTDRRDRWFNTRQDVLQLEKHAYLQPNRLSVIPANHPHANSRALYLLSLIQTITWGKIQFSRAIWPIHKGHLGHYSRCHQGHCREVCFSLRTSSHHVFSTTQQLSMQIPHPSSDSIFSESHISVLSNSHNGQPLPFCDGMNLTLPSKFFPVKWGCNPSFDSYIYLLKTHPSMLVCVLIVISKEKTLNLNYLIASIFSYVFKRNLAVEKWTKTQQWCWFSLFPQISWIWGNGKERCVLTLPFSPPLNKTHPRFCLNIEKATE